MARTLYGAIAKKFRRDLDKVINEKILRLGEDVSDAVAYNFVRVAQSKLERYGSQNAEDANSYSKIQQISDSIELVDETKRTLTSGNRYKKTKTGTTVRIPIDKDKLVLFLEYGTGLEGKNDPHEEANRFGWGYAINDNTVKVTNTKYRSFVTNWYPSIEGNGFYKRGFVFKYKNQYLDKNDYIFKNKYSEIKDIVIKEKFISVPQTIMHSKLGKEYTRRAYSYLRKLRPDQYITSRIEIEREGKNEYVVSSGLKPARFIYDTKTQIRQILRKYAYRDMNDKLKEKLFKDLDAIN